MLWHGEMELDQGASGRRLGCSGRVSASVAAMGGPVMQGRPLPRLEGWRPSARRGSDSEVRRRRSEEECSVYNRLRERAVLGYW